MIQRSEHHDGSALRFVLDGAAGPVELRITPVFAAVLHDGEAECLPGEEIAALWRAADCDDAVIWAELERSYPRRTADADAEDAARDPRFTDLRQAAAWVAVATEYGTAADAEQAENLHLEAIRRLIHRNQS